MHGSFETLQRWSNCHNTCLRLSSDLGAVMLSPDYRPMPEHKLPTAVDDAVSFFSVFFFVTNLGPGFDFLGCAVNSLSDFVSLTVDPKVHPGQISISDISGNRYASRLTKNHLHNCVGITAIELMKMLRVCSVGLSLSLHKGLPLGSGLGFSAASVVATVVAMNELFGVKTEIWIYRIYNFF